MKALFRWSKVGIVLTALFAITAEPALATLTLGKTNDQHLVGVGKYGNYSYKAGTRRGKGKVIIYGNRRKATVLLMGKGRVRNYSKRPQVFRNIGTRIELPDCRNYVYSESDLVIVTGLPWSYRGYNKTFASYCGPLKQKKQKNKRNRRGRRNRNQPV